MPLVPRYYQAEDVASVIRLWELGKLSVLVRQATGLGKSLCIAMLVKWAHAKGLRSLVLADVRKLVRQDAAEIYEYCGIRAGIEMADERAIHENGYCEADLVVGGTPQSMLSGGEGQERMLRVGDFDVLLLDEGESFLSPRYLAIVNHFRSRNPKLMVVVCTATPYRSDGLGMSNLCEDVAADRNIIWGIEDGWLTPVKQGFARASVDFSTLEVRRNDDGEEDYSDKGLAALIDNDKPLFEISNAVVKIAADQHKSVVVCPNVDTSIHLNDYINGLKPGSSRCVHSRMPGNEIDETMDAHKAGEFQFLCSVMMLTKGYNDKSISAIFNCRRTKSRRLYEQILGRGIRPLDGVVDGLPDAAARRASIASSHKPFALMVNLVGIKEEVRDMTVVDILGDKFDQEIIDRAKDIISERPMDISEALSQAKEEIENEQDLEQLLAEAEEAQLEMDEESRVRRRIVVDAHVEVKYDSEIGKALMTAADPGIPSKQLNLLRKFKVPEKVISKLGPQGASELSRKLVARASKGLCSYAQAMTLRKHGYSESDVATMKRAEAKLAIDALAANGWKR